MRGPMADTFEALVKIPATLLVLGGLFYSVYWYLAVHLRPQVPEKSEYPKRFRNVLLAVFILFAAWGIGALLTYSVRDHLT